MNDRRRLPRIREPRAALPVLALLAAISVAGCAGAAGPASTPPAASTPPTATPAATATPGGAALTEAEAVARVLAQDPRFSGIRPTDPDLIGQSAWYEVSPAVVGWRVVVTIGWGDCQAGEIRSATGRATALRAARMARARETRQWQFPRKAARGSRAGPSRVLSAPWSESPPTRPARTVPSPVP